MTHYRTILPMCIDFDEAHDAWMSNKRKNSNGMYRYICGATTKTGKPCGLTTEPNGETCSKHRSKPKATAKPSSIISKIYSFIRKTHTVSVEPIIDIVDETVLIRCDPPIRGSFSQIHSMLNHFDSMSNVIDDIQCNGINHNIEYLLLSLQLMLSFLDGLDELTKLETKHMKIARLKSRMLEFHGYNAMEYMHTTSTKWQETSIIIKESIISLMLHLFGILEHYN